jgi:predicted nucleic acid-binding protein
MAPARHCALMYLLDTNVLSQARRGTPQALDWLRSADPDRLYLSVITLGEIMRGIALKERSDPQTAAHLAAWLARLRQDHATRILPVTDRIAVEWGRVSALRPRGGADGLIAATALVHDLIVVTRNIADFADTGAACLNPWEL